MIRNCKDRTVLQEHLHRFGLGAVFCVLVIFVPQLVADPATYNLGESAARELIEAWDIDVRPDGVGLPGGSGDVDRGEEVYAEQCAACHGEFGEAFGRYPVLIGGGDTLSTHDPVKTIGSYWPYAPTLFDYIRRAMPFGNAQSLSDDDVYAVTAFLLWSNEIIEDDVVLDATTLAAIKMPNADGFISDNRKTYRAQPCTSNCDADVEVVGRARQVDVTPETEDAINEDNLVDVGRKLFSVCGVCHSVEPGRHLIGPSLQGVYGRKPGSVEEFGRYSAALVESDGVWDETALDAFMATPGEAIPGTAMIFAGVASAEDRAALIAYLKSL